MEVGFVTYGNLTQVSGGYRYNRKLIEYLRSCGDQVTVISLPQSRGVRALGDNFSRRIRRALDRPVDVLLQDELCYRSLLRHTNRLTEPATVIALVHLLELPGAAGRMHRLSAMLERRYLATVDGCIATSHHTARQIEAATDTETVVAYPGGRAEGAAVATDRVAVRARTGPLRVAFIGNLLPRKGLHTLLKALASLDQEWRATIVGKPIDRSYATRIEHQIDALSISEQVRRRGRVSEEGITSVLAASDVLAVPSAYESFGMVYLEAMEYGVVPIASGVGGANEYIEHGTNGYLVQPDTPEVLANHLARLGSDRDRLLAMGKAALATAQEHPTWAESLSQLRSALLATDGSFSNVKEKSDRE